MRITFLGAAQTVTGSQYLLETDRARVLVDCGMFQGSPHEVLRNRVPLAYEPRTIDALLLTHAHLDHCGLIPQVSAAGFRGRVYATRGTVELARLVLLDSAKLQEEFAAKHQRFARKHPDRALVEDRAAAAELAAATDEDAEEAIRNATPEALTYLREPLYTAAQATNALAQCRGIEYGVETEVAPGVTATYLDAGHILGSAIIRVRARDEGGDRTIVFSGDLGRPNTPIIRDPTPVREGDYLLVESTYGGRVHEPQEEAIRMLGECVTAVQGSKGVLLMPSFAIGRTQEVVFELDRLLEAGRIPRIPLYLDSPMASGATEIYRRYEDYFDAETRALLARAASPLDYPGAVIVKDASASEQLDSNGPRPFMVVASNGMITGGRIVQHVKAFIGDPAMTLLFVGYQGVGTLGAQLQQGARQVRIDGQQLDVACRVRSISGFSAHADEPELLAWLRNFTVAPKLTFVVHGDPAAQAAFEPKVRALGFATKVPRWRETVELV
ncbi:MAG: metallo-beta-lactamase family protein [Chloroflexota bacterium]|jgi:metallo-beta-lactamase family protein|nr:metallo-beta-lactamase family protein [Chloroflexota bacterium]